MERRKSREETNISSFPPPLAFFLFRPPFLSFRTMIRASGSFDLFLYRSGDLPPIFPGGQDFVFSPSTTPPSPSLPRQPPFQLPLPLLPYIIMRAQQNRSKKMRWREENSPSKKNSSSARSNHKNKNKNFFTSNSPLGPQLSHASPPAPTLDT